MAGAPNVTFRNLPKGTEVKMRFAEVTYPDMPAYKENKGMVMMENIRAAMAQDIYIAKGNNVERFSPHFTYHGFRFIEITGIPCALPLEDVKGIVLSSVDHLTSHFETSDSLVNRLWKNITWSTKANFMSLPTDSPQRNERMGWARDISVFSRSASYLTDAGQFVDTQVSYVLPLAFHLWTNENQRRLLADNLVETITRSNKMDDGRTAPPYSLLTGFIGTAWIAQALSDNGHTDTAYKLLTQKQFPYWLYPVTQGATTVWERLNSYTHKDGFGKNNRMNSFNHYSFGAVAAWMYDHSLGICRDKQSPAFRHFILSPEPDTTGNLTFAKGYYDSMYRRIKSEWETGRNQTVYRFTIPDNTSATLYLPVNSDDNISFENKVLKSYKIIKNKAVFKLRQGDYRITVKSVQK